jgi:uridine kinase
MKYIAIDGRGGSGKTHLANMLADQLGVTALHLDDFGNDYEPFVGIPKLIEAIENASGDIVIFEGVGVFDDRFDRFQPFRILVNTDPEVRRTRAAARDVPRSDRSADEWKKIYDIWRDAETAYFTDARMAKADLVTAADGRVDVVEIASRIRTA